MQTRIVQPEILDSLAHDDPVARANRKDLRTYNRLMQSPRWFRNQLVSLPCRLPVLEIGAGDGWLGRKVFTQSEFKDITGMDLVPRPAAWPNQWKWIQQDLLCFDYGNQSGILLANLILHQFSDEDLYKLGAQIQRSGMRFLIFSEPARKRFHTWQVGLSRLLGMHPVTLHDARVSVEAGFRRDECAQLLGLDKVHWMVSWKETFMGCNRLVCTRK